MNTAVALAAIFDLVRDVNTAMDRGTFLQQDAPRAVAAMEKFDGILAVLIDDDAEKLRKLGFGPAEARMNPVEIEALVEERQCGEAAAGLQALRRDPTAARWILVSSSKIRRTAASDGSTNEPIKGPFT